jgi:hypothetical protein
MVVVKIIFGFVINAFINVMIVINIIVMGFIRVNVVFVIKLYVFTVVLQKVVMTVVNQCVITVQPEIINLDCVNVFHVPNLIKMINVFNSY